jgi:energy-coupling factor transport system permease protein
MPLTPLAQTRDCALGRRNPTVKLGLVFVVSAVLLFVLDPFTPAVLYLLALAGVAATAGLTPRRLAVAHLPFAAFALGLFLVNALSRSGEVLWTFGPFQITAEGAEIGLALALRTLVIGVLSIGFVASTDPVALMTSLHQNARLGARFTYAVLAGYRMLQEMPREWETIRHAQSVRENLRRDGRPHRSLRRLARSVFTLLVVSLRKGERIAQALESRGLGRTPRSVWRPVPLDRADWLFAAALLAAVAAVLALSAALGLLRGPAALA